MQYSSKKYQQYMLHKRSMKLHNEKNHSITDNVLCFEVLKLEKPSINQNIDYAHLRLSLTQIQNHNPQVQTIENKKRTPEKNEKTKTHILRQTTSKFSPHFSNQYINPFLRSINKDSRMI